VKKRQRKTIELKWKPQKGELLGLAAKQSFLYPGVTL